MFSKIALIALGTLLGSTNAQAQLTTERSRYEQFVDQSLELKLRGWNPKSIPEAYSILSKDSVNAVNAAKRGYDVNKYTWGSTIPTYGLAKDPLATDCMVQVERYRGLNCIRGQEDQQNLWPTYTAIFQEGSKKCIRNFDFDLGPSTRQIYDMNVRCSNDSVSVLRYNSGSNCNPSSRRQVLYADWRVNPDRCVNVPGENLSYRLKRNNTRNIEYYKSAYAVEEWLKVNSYDSNAGQCLIKGFEAYVDSDCQVKAESVDNELDLAVDIGNFVSMYSSNRCGPVGHIFPFQTPFARVWCNSLQINITQYFDWQCRDQFNDTFSYKWGQCIQYPWLSRGVKYIRLYQQPRLTEEDVAIADYYRRLNNSTEDYELYQNEYIMWIIISGLILLVLIILCMACGIYQMRMASMGQVDFTNQIFNGGMAAQLRNSTNILDTSIQSQGNNNNNSRLNY